ncbi:VOC family protein [Salinispirillum marinum]|uniref:VOC family protein n=2 Tax=Saccharospirillaceae TaxID=255527 RepID=A0ABV8BHG0_9GAMM
MYLEHLNLFVPNLEDVLKFYRTAFPHWRIRDEGHGEWYGKPRKWVHFGDDHQYLAFSAPGEGTNRNLKSNNVGLAHFAYVTNNIEAVITRLTDAGFEIAKSGATEPFRKNVYFIDPAGFEVEFVEYLSDIPAERNLNQETQ